MPRGLVILLLDIIAACMWLLVIWGVLAAIGALA